MNDICAFWDDGVVCSFLCTQSVPDADTLSLDGNMDVKLHLFIFTNGSPIMLPLDHRSVLYNNWI